jgi:Mn-dependent DtxR family transcriptional regulator
MAHWHAEGRMSYPHTNTIAKRMGVSQRSVQGSVSWLVKEGFMAKLPKRNSHDRQRNSLKPMVEKVEALRVGEDPAHVGAAPPRCAVR